MLDLVILGLFCILLVLLLAEKQRAVTDRRQLSHLVYVNGIRGKSSVTRLIDAGLRAGGLRVFCKTTGTLPMTIDTKGCERLIRRRGCANIKEQLWTLHRAAADHAEILVAECMAVDPVLQKLSQQQMLKADIGVITNVRLDHTEEMGATLPEICDSLCCMIPENGTVFTADSHFAPRIAENAQKLGASCVLAPAEKFPVSIDFDENVSLALAVCENLGVPRATAFAGIKNYQRDPFALSVHRLMGGGIAIGALSANDPQSTLQIWDMVQNRYLLSEKRLILLINNRRDRGYRTEHMLLVANRLTPDEIWLMGASRQALAHRLHAQNHATVRCFSSAAELPLRQLDAGNALFAVGNVAGEGHALMERIRREGERLVP